MNPLWGPNCEGCTLLRVCGDGRFGRTGTMGLDCELSDDSGEGSEDGEFFNPPGPFTLPHFNATAVLGLIMPLWCE